MNQKSIETSLVNIYGFILIATCIITIPIEITKGGLSIESMGNYYWSIGGSLVGIGIGVALLQRNTAGIYGLFLISFILIGMGVVLLIPIFLDIFTKSFVFQEDLHFFWGFLFIGFSIFNFLFFRKKSVLSQFGLEKIAILDKVTKKDFIDLRNLLIKLAILVGIVLLVCYLIVYH